VVGELGINVPSGFPLYWGVPNIQLSGFTTIGEASDTPFANWDTIFQWTDNLTWTKGKHNIKIGADLRRTRFNQLGGVVTRGRFSFDGRYSTGPAGGATQANVAADFLLAGISTSEGQVGVPIANMRNNYFAVYVQDDWRVTSKLTINAGLRWEDETPWTDKYDNIVNIDFHWDNSAFPVYVRAGNGDPYQYNPPFKLPPNIPYVRDGRFGNGAFMNTRRTSRRDWAPPTASAPRPSFAPVRASSSFAILAMLRSTLSVTRHSPPGATNRRI